MSLTDDLNGLVIEFSERKDFFKALEDIKVMSNNLLNLLTKFEYIKNKGSFATIPDELKTVILRWEAAFQICKDTLMDDPEIVEIFQWEK